MANKNSINNSEINVEQLYDASGNMIYPLIRFDSRYSVSSPEQLSFPADGEIAYNLKHGVPRFYADKLIEDVEITTDFKSRQIAAYQGNSNESYPLMVFSTAKGDLYSFVPKGTFATEEYVNDEISKVQIGSGGNVDIEALKKYIDGLIDDKLDNVDGNENVNALTIMAYKATDSSLTPDTPIGGSWTRGNDGKIEIDYPDGWGSPSSEEAVNGKYLWTSSSIQMSGGKFLSSWTLPLCINSDDTLYSDAASVFTSFAFTRNNKNLYNITVTGGDYNNPIPIKETHTIGGLDVEVEWYDTVPTNSEEIVWMVKRTFSSNEGDSIDKGWSRPVQMTDTTDFEVIYSAVEAYNSIPGGFSKAEDGVSINSSWLENAHAAGWYDDPEDCVAKDVSENSIKMPPIWMATSKCHNGDWSEWNIVQIKGEDGKDGTKINIKGTYDSYEDLYMAWKNDKTNYAAGDSYVVSFVNVDSSNNWIKPIYDEETQTWTNSTDNSKDGMQGVLFVYDGSDEWIFSGQFKGDSAFIHIKYANDASLDDENSFNISIDGKIVTVVPTEHNGEEPGKYIGIYTDNKLEDSNDYTKNYKWSLLKGEDGWGYEYIYYLCAEEPEGGVKTPHYNESDEFFNSDEYQKDDYIPEGWTDSQSGVSTEYPFEYVCHRKYVDGKWSKFIGSASDYSIAALCSKYGKDGMDAIQPAAVYKSIVFTRTDVDISEMDVEGGTYDNPIPNEKLYNDVSIAWHDSVPEGKSLLWATSRIFSTDVDDPLATDWSAPVKMADSIDLEIIYSAYTALNDIPDNFSKADDGVSINEDWLNAANVVGWYDEPEQCKNKDGVIVTPIWMATSEKSNGVWSEWNIMQIKGEDGKDGTSINVIDSYPTYEDLYNATTNNPENFNQGDAYVVEVVKIDKNGEWINPYDESGNLINGTNTELNEGESYLRGVLFVYDGSDNWKFCGQFKGDSAFIHIKYAELSAEGNKGAFNTTVDGTDIWLAFTSNNGEIPGKYVGMYTDNLIDDSADPSLYKWSKWQGEDGWGYEYVYLRTNSNQAPDVPNYSNYIDTDLYQKDDFIPGVTDQNTGWNVTSDIWTDSQSGVTQTDQYEYVCHRKYVDGKWSQFYGSSSNPGYAALCSKFGQDGQPGQDGKTIEYIYLLTSETPKVPEYDEDFINSLIYQENDFIPGVTDAAENLENAWETAWQDSPIGISEDNPTEWFCTRKRDKTSQQWGPFQGPGLWAKWGVNGQDGDGVQYIYVATAGDNEVPDNPTPQGYDDKNSDYQDKNGEWGNGKPVTINSGTSTDYEWSDDPQGVSIDMKTEWVAIRKYRDSSWGPYSVPKPWAMFGKEGTNGANLRTMYGVFSDASTKEEIEELITKDNIDPGSVWGYTKDFEQGQKLWSIYAYTDYSNNLVEIYDSSRNETIYGWQGPFIAATYGKDGSAGKQGPTGEPGLTGLPGNSFEIRYCLGKINDPDTTEDDSEGKEYQDNILNVEDVSNYDSSGWYKTTDDIYSKISEDWPYVYCVQGEKTYTRDEDNKEVETIIWGSPFRLSGLNGMNGIDGSDGKNGQIVYPVGVYDPTKTYTLDDYKAPYVYDSKDGNYYVLNIESWLGTEYNGVSPSDIQGVWEDANNYWQLIENYEAVFAKVGIISNGMVGSAVFNGDYMFSQIGLENSGNMSDNYEYFMQNENEEKTETPYDSSCIWKPSYCVNLRTGQVWSGAGTIVFNSDGSGKLASGEISWDSSGNLKMPTIASLLCKYVLTDDNILINYLNCNGSISNGRFGDTINLLFKFYLDNDFTNLIYEEEVIDFKMPNSFNYNFNINSAQSVELYSRTLVKNELGEENNIDKLLAKYIIETANTRVNTLEITNNIGDSSVVIDLIYNDSSIRIENDETKTINISESNILSWYVKNLNTNDNKATQYSYWLTSNKSVYNHVLDRVFDLKARPYGYMFKNVDHNLQVIYKNANPIEVNDNKADQIYYRNFQYNIINNSSDDIDFWPLSFSDVAIDTENGYVLNDNITPSFRLASGETFVYNNLIAYEDLNGAEFSLGLTNLVIKTLKNNNISINLNSKVSALSITHALENFEDKTIGFDIEYDYSDSNDKLIEDKLIDINITLFDIISSDEDIDIDENGNFKS